MASTEITVGILAPSEETRELLRLQVNATGLAAVEVEVDQYCAASGDRPTRRFLESRPDIIIVDMQDQRAALQTLHILHAALPDTWLFVSSPSTEPQLIIETMRAGAREFFPKPIPARNMSEALGRFIAEKQRRQKDIGKIYCVTSAKGGVGATTLSINLATSLAAAPKTQVALIDLSGPVGDAASNLNLKPQFTVTDALHSAARLDPVLLESFASHVHGVSVLPGPNEFRPGQIPGADALAKLLEVVTQAYTHAIVDLSSALDKEQLQVATGMATNVVVVLTPELPALLRTERLLRYLSSIGLTDKLRLVMNRYRKSDEITDTEIEKALKCPLFWKLPNNYMGAIRAINSGDPVVSTNHSELADSYRELAYRLAELPPPEKRRGRFRLF